MIIMIKEKNLKKDYRTNLFIRILNCLSDSGKTTNMILTELRKEYPKEYNRLTWNTIQNRLLSLHEEKKQQQVKLDMIGEMKKPIYIWRKKK